jgi:LAS superfamily LD-carboxypeptidase LdcB
MIKSGKFAGHEHGPAAQRHMLSTMLPVKAPPGFSNHSNGTAVDFKTSYDGVLYVADTSQHTGWQGTWLHPWLVANARTYGFKPLSSEEWHWDHA